jgi:hypothetical protein
MYLADGKQVPQRTSHTSLLSVMKLGRLFTTQPCPAFYKYHSVGAHRGWSPSGGGVALSAGRGGQTDSASEPGHSGSGAWAAMLSGAALSYILSDASRYSQRPAVSLTLQLATACVRVNAPLDRSYMLREVRPTAGSVLDFFGVEILCVAGAVAQRAAESVRSRNHRELNASGVACLRPVASDPVTELKHVATTQPIGSAATFERRTS